MSQLPPVNMTIELPSSGDYVCFSESGAGQPARLIIQFKELDDMQQAHLSLAKSIRAVADLK